MMATVPHATSGLGLRKFQAVGFLLTRVYLFISGKFVTETETCLTRLIAGLSPQRLGFYPRTVLPGVVDRLTITQVLLRVI